jgi:uncharacterized protein YaiL (DUF2058 family)
MSNSLFDQLKKTGLVDDKKANKVKKEKYKTQKQQIKQHKETPSDEARLQAQRAQAEKAERDRLLNQQRQAEAERKAIAAQIRQLIETNRISERDGEVAYNFTDGSKVKRLYISEELHRQLGRGRLAIVRLGEGYELVPTPVAEKIRQRDEACVVVCDQPSGDQPDAEDPYADYQIPDDLMW